MADKPTFNEKHFDFYKIGKSLSETKFGWTMVFKDQQRNKTNFNNCNEIATYNPKNIALFDQFRFKLFIADCTAIYKYIDANDFNKSFFPKEITHKFIASLPAHSTPIITRHGFQQHKGKSLKSALNPISIKDKNDKVNLTTDNEEIYINIIARGDFNNDNIEDLLVDSQWYAKKARGKYNDLVILSKTDKDKPVEITWRMHGPNW